MRTVTSDLASSTGKPPWPPEMLGPTTEAGGLDDRRGHDLVVQDDGELLAVVLLRVVVEEPGAGVLELKVHDDLAGGGILGDGGAGDLDTREERFDVQHGLRQRALGRRNPGGPPARA